ncbi:unnamed protein product [Lactuca saligna]|uniref:Uncharacterized protein n=1 Tax=Lactuca saligna TaxID=75948 RepID=A0AA35YND4_LACSI|nr:unnamed protein product [Lactuca saligna]
MSITNSRNSAKIWRKRLQMSVLNFHSLNQKVDIICDVVTKFAKFYESLSPQITQLSTTENKNSMEVFSMLKELKALSFAPNSSSLLSSEDLINKFSKFEGLLLQQLDLLSRISSLLPTIDAPPGSTGVQGGEKKVEGTKASGEDAKVVGKVFPSKIPT